jgi:hypothetical protein
MARGASRRNALVRLLRRILTEPVQTTPTNEPPVAAESEHPGFPAAEPSAPPKPKVWARYLPPLLLVVLTIDELHRWRTQVGLAVAFGIWLARTFIHLRQGAFLMRNRKGRRPLRVWIYLEGTALIVPSVLLLLNAAIFSHQTFQGLILVCTALYMLFIAQCERLKIEDEQKKGDRRFQSGTEWLLDAIFDDTLSMRRIAPGLSRFRVVPFIVNILSLTAASAFFPVIPATEYAAYTKVERYFHSSAQPASTGKRGGTARTSPSASPSHPTYDDICVETRRGVKPGDGAADPVKTALHDAFYDGGPGEGYTGCFTTAQVASPATYYQLGLDPQSAELKSVIIATAGCTTSLIWGDEAAPLRNLLDRHLSLCLTERHAVKDGAVRFISTPDGAFVLARPNEATRYATLSPAETAGWTWTEQRLHRWLWPIRDGSGLRFVDQTSAPVDFAVVAANHGVVVTEDGAVIQHFTGGNSKWADVRAFALQVH